MPKKSETALSERVINDIIGEGRPLKVYEIPTSGPKLSHKHELFCREYLADFNPRAAALRAGYSPITAKVAHIVLLKDDQIVTRINELITWSSARKNLIRNSILDFLAQAITYQCPVDDDGDLDISKIPKHLIEYVKKTKEGVEIRTFSKAKAIELLGKYLAMWGGDSIEHAAHQASTNISFNVVRGER